MHIPDGVLSPEVCAGTAVLAAGAVGYSLHRLRLSPSDRVVPLTGMMAAVIFAGQMVNFPISLFGIPAVSGHLLGGVLASAILGPWGGCVALFLVLLVQGVLFADGGLLSLGANTLNMAVIGAWGGYGVLTFIRNRFANKSRGLIVGVLVASWLSVLAAAALFCGEVWLSWNVPDFDFGSLFALMVTVHSAIGIGEALITGSIVSFLLLHRRDLVSPMHPLETPRVRLASVLVMGFVSALAVCAVLGSVCIKPSRRLGKRGRTHVARCAIRRTKSLVPGGICHPIAIHRLGNHPCVADSFGRTGGDFGHVRRGLNGLFDVPCSAPDCVACGSRKCPLMLLRPNRVILRFAIVCLPGPKWV